TPEIEIARFQSEARHTQPNQTERPPSPGIRRSPRPVRRPSADPALAQPMGFTSSDVAVFLSARRDEASANDTPGSQYDAGSRLSTEGSSSSHLHRLHQLAITTETCRLDFTPSLRLTITGQVVAVPLTGSIACVLAAQQAPKGEKGPWMYRHKSLGLLTGLIVAPRLGYRIFKSASYKIGHPVGTGPVEGKIADLSHLLLYGFMTIMPATGSCVCEIARVPGKNSLNPKSGDTGSAEPNGAIAKQSFSIHKTMGVYGKYLVPIHVAGAFKHTMQGHAIWSRISPFGRPPMH
ncbi:hypothetical protein THAOC_03309, partial [Thalassiosira oceanica]